MIADRIKLAEQLQQESKFEEACVVWQEVCLVLPVYTAAYHYLAIAATAIHNEPLANWAKKQQTLFSPQQHEATFNQRLYIHQSILKTEFKPEVIVPPTVAPPALPNLFHPPTQPNLTAQEQILSEFIDTKPLLPPELLDVPKEIEWQEEQAIGYPELSWQTLESAIDKVEVNPKTLSRLHPKMQADLGFDSLDDLISQLEQAPRMKPIVGQIGEDEDENLPEIDLDDMVSETLALIYAKQKQYEEAAEIYEKLMLQEPHKADYYQQKSAEMRKK